MFSKHVWYDRKHQVEVFLTDDGAISGTIVAYEGAVSVINPRPEILTALYQEAKLKRILSLKGIILTDNTIDYTRGVCALVSYSRGLRRRTPLSIVTRSDALISTDVLNRCCAQLLGDALFEVKIESLNYKQEHRLGSGTIRFAVAKQERFTPTSRPILVLQTDKKTIHYLDESHTDAKVEHHDPEIPGPSVIIRAAEFPKLAQESKHRLTVLS